MSSVGTSVAESGLDRPSPQTASQTILLVINPGEMNLFLSGFNPNEHSTSDARYCWLDTNGLTEEGWREALEHYRPSVLMTGWSTPTIPEAWALAPDSPLRYVCQITGSVRKAVSRTLVEHGIVVTNWGTLISHTIAEHALLLTLGTLRNVAGWSQHITKATPVFALETRSLRGKRVGLHGFGAIARELIAMLKPHGVQLSSYSAPVPRAYMESLGVIYRESLEELFSQSDIVIECEGLTPESQNTVTERILRLMPERAVFVNVGRAAVTDEAALIRLAKEGRLRVGVDVYGQEPLVPDSPWLGTPNTFISPHIAGPTWDTYPSCGKRALENVARHLRGEAVLEPITLQKYDVST